MLPHRDSGQARVQKFDENGGFLNKWGGIGTDDGKDHGWSFTCRLSKGRYGTRIIAYDRAGNESGPGFGTLTVK